MKVAPQQLPDLDAVAGLLAHRLGIKVQIMKDALDRTQLFLSPGAIVDGEKPMTIGTLLNLRREFPGTVRAAWDIGWVVSGYTRKRGTRWSGYTLHRHTVHVESNSMSNCEACDVLDRYNAPPA